MKIESWVRVRPRALAEADKLNRGSPGSGFL